MSNQYNSVRDETLQTCHCADASAHSCTGNGNGTGTRTSIDAGQIQSEARVHNDSSHIIEPSADSSNTSAFGLQQNHFAWKLEGVPETVVSIAEASTSGVAHIKASDSESSGEQDSEHALIHQDSEHALINQVGDTDYLHYGHKGEESDNDIEPIVKPKQRREMKYLGEVVTPGRHRNRKQTTRYTPPLKEGHCSRQMSDSEDSEISDSSSDDSSYRDSSESKCHAKRGLMDYMIQDDSDDPSDFLIHAFPSTECNSNHGQHHSEYDSDGSNGPSGLAKRRKTVLETQSVPETNNNDTVQGEMVHSFITKII